MTGKGNLPTINDHGDNGWWKFSGAKVRHYFQDKIPTCGWSPSTSGPWNLQRGTCYDDLCKNCLKVRKNRLIARMNYWTQMYNAKKVLQPEPDPDTPKQYR